MSHMNFWVGAVSLAGILSTAVIYGTDMFFLTIGRSALRSASASAGNEVMGYLHLFADARMPVWGVVAVLANLLMAVVSRGEQRWLYLASLLMLAVFLVVYSRWSKPINLLLTEAVKTGRRLDHGRDLQASWDRLLTIRVPLLAVSMLAQCLGLLAASR